ncbi:MAG: aldo/keto reductase [Alphaproteobacteria bacterium]|jgi:diketogulonate reductase-like aldo/keto reductase
MTDSEHSGGVVRRVATRGGAALPSLGLGTWRMGEDSSLSDREVAALRLGLDMGMDLIDTAEMYADGGAEQITGEAIKGRRDAVTIVTKVHPSNGSRKGVIEAAERSLKRLGTDRIDLYLLHWQGTHPLSETFDAFAQLVHEEKILNFGVSNFDTDGMVDAEAITGGSGMIANQVLYNVNRRGIEWDLLPWCEERQIAVMAYSPLDDGKLSQRPGLSAVAQRHGVSEATVALAWTLRQPSVVTIPKASNPDHVAANYAAAGLVLNDQDRADLDGDFPPPDRATPLVIT